MEIPSTRIPISNKYQLPKMNYPAAEQRGIYNGIVTPQAAGNETLVRLRRIQGKKLRKLCGPSRFPPTKQIIFLAGVSRKVAVCAAAAPPVFCGEAAACPVLPLEVDLSAGSFSISRGPVCGFPTFFHGSGIGFDAYQGRAFYGKSIAFYGAASFPGAQRGAWAFCATK